MLRFFAAGLIYLITKFGDTVMYIKRKIKEEDDV